MSFSVVIPLFNKKETIGRALDSIKRQKIKPVEILVVNDGSTDGSEDIVLSMDIQDLRIINQENAGVSAARNKGVVESRGDWITFLDADDEWLPDFLSTIADMQKKIPDKDLYATAYYSGDYNGNRKTNLVKCLPFRGEQGELTNYFEVASKSSPPICSSAVCLRKKRLLEIGGFPTGITAGEDLITWARIAALSPPAYCIKPLAVFWQDKAHTYDDIPNRVPQRDDLVGKSLCQLKNKNELYTSSIEMYISHWHKMRASIYLRLGMRWRAFIECCKGLHHSPANYKLFAYLFLIATPNSFIRQTFKKFGS